jgi:type IV pilus assembly protein PilB
MVVTERIREQISTKSSADLLRKIAREEGMKTLRDDGLQKALAGITTLEEVIQVSKTG